MGKKWHTCRKKSVPRSNEIGSSLKGKTEEVGSSQYSEWINQTGERREKLRKTVLAPKRHMTITYGIHSPYIVTLQVSSPESVKGEAPC